MRIINKFMYKIRRYHLGEIVCLSVSAIAMLTLASIGLRSYETHRGEGLRSNFSDLLSTKSETAKRIPFYLYDGPEIQSLWTDCGNVDDRSMGVGGHEGDYYSYLSAQNHSWRVLHAEEALLFVLPIPWNALFNSICKHPEIKIRNIMDMLKSSPHLVNHNGADHLTITNHWAFVWWLEGAHPFLSAEFQNTENDFRTLMSSFLRTSHFIDHQRSCQVVVPYTISHDLTSRMDNSESYSETEDFLTVGKRYLSKRKYTLGFVGRTLNPVHAHGYDERRLSISSLSDFRGPNVLVSIGKETEKESCNESVKTNCWSDYSPKLFSEAVTNSKYCLHFRGDDWTSQRLYDCIASGTIPVVISDGLLDMGLPFQCAVDWQQILIRIPQKEFVNNPKVALSEHLPNENTDEGIYQIGKKVFELQNIRNLVLFEHPKSQTLELILLQIVRSCIPESYILSWTGHQKENRRRSFLTAEEIVKEDNNTMQSLSDLPCLFNDVSKSSHLSLDHKL